MISFQVANIESGLESTGEEISIGVLGFDEFEVLAQAIDGSEFDPEQEPRGDE